MKDIKKEVEPILLAGKIMTESGSEIYRIEDTMRRMALNTNLGECHSYVTMTGVFISFSEPPYTLFLTAYNRTTDLSKVVQVNSISRLLQEKKLNDNQLLSSLQEIDRKKENYPFILRLFAAGVVSGCLMIIFGGFWQDYISTFVIGMMGYGVSQWLIKRINVNYFNYFGASVVIGVMALAMQKLGWLHNIENIIVGSLMPLVPGVAITNAFRDLLSGHLIGGLARGVEAIIIAGSIGSGIAMVLMLWR